LWLGRHPTSSEMESAFGERRYGLAANGRERV
jgi:hypothetical protein